MTKTILLIILRPFIGGILLGVSYLSSAQSNLDSLLHKIDPVRLADCIEKKSDKLEQKLIAKSEKALTKLQREEEKIYTKMLRGKDSLVAKTKLNEIRKKYAEKRNILQQSKQGGSVTVPGQYLPRLDSLTATLKFLDENGMSDKVRDALSATNALQQQFQQAEEIKKFIKERREQLKQQLEKLGMIKSLKKFNKQFYYYTAQIKEYKEILKDPKKIERKALELLSKTKVWKEFFRKNSMLAGLFRLPNPDEPINTASLAGLQTRTQVTNLIQQQIQSGGPNGMQQFQQNLQTAQSQLNQLKDKILKSGGNSTDDELPDFKPNQQKTKSFFRRLELGANVQSQKATNFFPVTSDLGFSVGYKLTDRSVIGIGASYKLGWGRGWNNIRMTSEGVGLRSYVDIKLKGSFKLSGGYEQNYRSSFGNLNQLPDFSSWQQSGLIGIGKTVSLKSKLFKQTSIKLLWDFLSYQQVPRTQAIVFRFGYHFN